MNIIEFNEWKSKQDTSYKSVWWHKWNNKSINAVLDGRLNLLTFDEYLFKAFEAKLVSPDQIGSTKKSFNLSRLNDEGDYKVDNCRFITVSENQSEQDRDSYLRGTKNYQTQLTEEQVIAIWYDPRTNHHEISLDYPCSRRVVYSIKNRQNWTTITDKLQ